MVIVHVDVFAFNSLVIMKKSSTFALSLCRYTHGKTHKNESCT